MSTLHTLRRARALIRDLEHWTQGSFARDINSEECEACDPDACRWCAIGALQATADTADEYDSALLELAHSGVGLATTLIADSLVAWNDSHERTHGEVLEAFDQAIVCLEQSGRP